MNMLKFMDGRAPVRVRPQAPASPADGYLGTRADWLRQLKRRLKIVGQELLYADDFGDN